MERRLSFFEANNDDFLALAMQKHAKKPKIDSVKENGVEQQQSKPNLKPNPESGAVLCKNDHLAELDIDFLYHIGFTTEHDLKKLFGDVRFVILGGSKSRMEYFSNVAKKTLGIELPFGTQMINICDTDRYSMFKLEHVLAVSHGMGMPSMSIILHEVTKLLHYAEATNVKYIRIGTSGGIGVDPGTIVVSESICNNFLESKYRLQILDREYVRDTHLNKPLMEKISQAAKRCNYNVTAGKTLSTNDFYEGQGRLDGAICHYSESEKMEYLRRANEEGVQNIEMESMVFAAFCHHVEIPAAMVAVTLLDRLKGDQMTKDVSVLKGYGKRPVEIICDYLKHEMDEFKALQNVAHS